MPPSASCDTPTRHSPNNCSAAASRARPPRATRHRSPTPAPRWRRPWPCRRHPPQPVRNRRRIWNVQPHKPTGPSTQHRLLDRVRDRIRARAGRTSRPPGHAWSRSRRARTERGRRDRAGGRRRLQTPPTCPRMFVRGSTRPAPGGTRRNARWKPLPGTTGLRGTPPGLHRLRIRQVRSECFPGRTDSWSRRSLQELEASTTLPIPESLVLARRSTQASGARRAPYPRRVVLMRDAESGPRSPQRRMPAPGNWGMSFRRFPRGMTSV